MESKDFVKGTILGAIVGTMAGILFAPSSGKETRKEIHQRFDEIKSDLISKLSELDDFTKKTYDQVVGSVISGYEESKKITKDEALEIKTILESSFSQIEDSLAKTKQKMAESAKEKKK